MIRLVMACLLSAVLCFVFILNSISAPMVHNYTRYSYTVTASSGVNQNNGGYIYLTDNICVTYPVFLSLSEDGEPFIDTDHTRENKIPLDVVITITSENAKTIFTIDNYDREVTEKGKIVFERDDDLEYAVRYLLNR